MEVEEESRREEMDGDVICIIISIIPLRNNLHNNIRGRGE